MVRLVPNAEYRFLVDEDLSYSTKITVNKSRYIIFTNITKGFGSDLQSIPWFLDWAFKKYEWETAQESVLHDALCRSLLVPRYIADLVFYTELKTTGFDLDWAYYGGVRIGSYSPRYRPTFEKMLYAREYVEVDIKKL